MAPYRIELFKVAGPLLGILLGYDMGIVGASLPAVQQYFVLSDAQVSWFIGIFAVAEVFGSPFGGLIANTYGRRWAIFFAVVVSASGMVIMLFAESFEALLLGRVFAGIGVGAAMAQAPVYLAELSPTDERGSIVSMVEFNLNIGILFGFVAGFVFRGLPHPADFRAMFALGIPFSVIIAAMVPFIPESPRWLLLNHREQEAREQVKRFISADEMERMVHEFAVEKRTKQQASFMALFSMEALHSMIVSTFLTVCISCCGIDAVTLYGQRLLKESGMELESDRCFALILMGVVKTWMILVGSLSMDSVKRIFLLMLSFGAMGVAGSLFLVPGLAIRSPMLGVAGMMCFSGAFSIGTGPIYFCMSAELWPMHLRSVGSSYMHAVRGIFGAIVNGLFLVLVDRYSMPVMMGIGCGFCFLAVPMVYVLLPETCGRSLEEIIVTRRASITSLDDRNGIIDDQPTELLRRTSLTIMSGEAWGDAKNVPPAAG